MSILMESCGKADGKAHVDDTGNVTKDGQEDVDPEVLRIRRR